jgi:hypothetical protein
VTLSFSETEVRRAAFSGNESRLGVFYSVGPDCVGGAIPDIRLVRPPANGEVSFQETRTSADFDKESRRANCNGKPVDGVVMNYRSREGYSGTDRFQIEVDYKAGVVRGYSVIVNVR